nr:hypothetical protein [Tanacetum cinerariifolium]
MKFLNKYFPPTCTVKKMEEINNFQLNVPTRQIFDSKGTIPTKTVADAKIAIQEIAKYSQKWHNETSLKNRSTKTSDRLATIQAQLNNLRREIKKVNKKVYVAQVGCELCKGPHTKECPLMEEGNTLEEAYYTQLATIQAQLNNLRREIKKVNKKVYAAQVGCELCKGPHTKECPLMKEGNTLEEAYYTQFGAPYQPAR